MVKAAVNRELGEGEEVVAPHRHRVPLGLVMLAQGWITHPQLRQALESQRAEWKWENWRLAGCRVRP